MRGDEPEGSFSFVGIGKRFHGVQALRDVGFDVAQGSCHALCGENDAGQSFTLGKMAPGIYAPDSSELIVDGKAARFAKSSDAMAAGIDIVHQELAFCENLTVAENLCLGQLPARKLTFMSRNHEMLRQATPEYLCAIEAKIDPTNWSANYPSANNNSSRSRRRCRTARAY